MNILVLTPEFSPNILGGLGVHVTNLMNALSLNEKLNIFVYTFKYPNSSYSNIMVNDNVKVRKVKGIVESDNLDGKDSILLSNYNIVSEVLKSNEKYNLIHAHDFMVGASAIILKETLQIPLLTTFHDTLIGRSKQNLTNEFGKVFIPMQKKMAELSDGIICCSEDMKVELVKFYKIDNSKVNVIFNGINTTNIHKIDYEIKERTVITYIGRLSKEKGIADLMNAIKYLIAKGHNVQLNIIGKINYFGEELIKSVLNDNLLTNSVKFFGFQDHDNINEELIKSDIVVVPSHYEPFGIVALEASILAVPLIVTNVGGLKEIVEDGENGLVIEPFNPEELKEKILNLIRNKNLRKKLGESAREKAFSFSWNHIGDKTYANYKYIIDRG